MIVVVSPTTGSVELRDPGNFKAFHVETTSGSTIEETGNILGTAPTETVDHVWVAITQLRDLAGPVENDWHDGLAQMLTFASSKGWLSDDGERIMAHVEWV